MKVINTWSISWRVLLRKKYCIFLLDLNSREINFTIYSTSVTKSYLCDTPLQFFKSYKHSASEIQIQIMPLIYLSSSWVTCDVLAALTKM